MHCEQRKHEPFEHLGGSKTCCIAFLSSKRRFAAEKWNLEIPSSKIWRVAFCHLPHILHHPLVSSWRFATWRFMICRRKRGNQRHRCQGKKSTDVFCVKARWICWNHTSFNRTVPGKQKKHLGVNVVVKYTTYQPWIIRKKTRGEKPSVPRIRSFGGGWFSQTANFFGGKIITVNLGENFESRLGADHLAVINL